MLQQTRVATVIPFFQRFLDRFPDAASLASADLDTVLSLWSGLGYYARARNLHQAARQLVRDHDGRLPADMQALQALPGIGRSTAGAILAQAFGQPVPILDGNARRVLVRYFRIRGWPRSTANERLLWELADWLTPDTRTADYTQAIMDLGAGVCARVARCNQCPQQDACAAHRYGETSRLPEAPPRKALPERHTGVLLLVDGDGAVLLERRPPHGIWGGLWSLPEYPVRADPVAWARRRLGLRIGPARRLPAVDHTFSHFRLRMQPSLHRLHSGAAVMEGGGQLWYKGAATPVGVPAPVSRLIEGVPWLE
jgi:A/G-specific adenine glycosylase